MFDGEKIPVKTVDLFLYITSGDSHLFSMEYRKAIREIIISLTDSN
jgi:hypothetical protein